MIKKFKLFEQNRFDIDPYGEEIWDEIRGFDIKKVPLIKGGYYYFASFHDDNDPVDRSPFQWRGVKNNDYILSIGEIWEKGYNFNFHPLPDWDFEELNENEKELFFNDKLKVKVFHHIVKDEGTRRDIVYGGDFQDVTFSELLKLFKISKEDFLMSKSN